MSSLGMIRYNPSELINEAEGVEGADDVPDGSSGADDVTEAGSGLVGVIETGC